MCRKIDYAVAFHTKIKYPSKMLCPFIGFNVIELSLTIEFKQ